MSSVHAKLLLFLLLQVIAQSNTFILAGYETTANTLAYCIYNIAAHPEVQQRLLAEVDAFGSHKTISARDMDQVCVYGGVCGGGLGGGGTINSLYCIGCSSMFCVVAVGQGLLLCAISTPVANTTLSQATSISLWLAYGVVSGLFNPCLVACPLLYFLLLNP